RGSLRLPHHWPGEVHIVQALNLQREKHQRVISLNSTVQLLETELETIASHRSISRLRPPSTIATSGTSSATVDCSTLISNCSLVSGRPI
ncbi:hypothetical protein LINPERPRIM_LOCUS21183, partial [Linum perenne]